MNKSNNNSIFLGLKILSVLVFSLLMIPAKASAEGGVNYVFSTYTPPIKVDRAPLDNPKPVVDAVNPGFENKGANPRTVTITGENFVPASIARVNGNDRLTTFIDENHLLIQLNYGDMNRTEGFYISVFNPLPGGGYSNAVYFTIVYNKPISANVNNNNGNNNNRNNTSGNTTNRNSSNNNYSNNSNSSNNSENNTSDNTYSDLASNAIFGAKGFAPSGLVQWIIFAIFVLVIVILARKVFGAKDKYHAAPLKHA